MVIAIDDSKAILYHLESLCAEQNIDFQGTTEWSLVSKMIFEARKSCSVLFISDFQMRERGGLDGDCIVKSLRKPFPDLPVVLFSANPERVTNLVAEMKQQYPQTPITVIAKGQKERLEELLTRFRDAVWAGVKVVF